MTRTFILAVAAAVLAALPGSSAWAQSVPRHRTLIICQGADPVYLWPNGSTTSYNLNAGAAIVESFVWTDPRTGKIEPLLAESWRFLNETTLQLKLRRGVTFSNGEPFNAAAAKFSLDLIRDAKLTPAYSRYTGPISGVEVVDEYTLNVRTKGPYPGLLLTLYRAFVVPPKYWKEAGKNAYNLKPVGTGPYKLREWVKDDRLVMDKFADYWGTVPGGIDRVTWRPIPDDTARVAALETGECDLIGNMPVTAVRRVEGNRDLRAIKAESLRVYSLTLSSLKEHPSPLHDKRVRQALNYAIDNNSIVRNLFDGQATVLDGQLLVKGQLGYNPRLKPYPYDPDRARRLLAEAGYPNGFSVPFKFPSGRFAQDREVAEAVAGMLAKVGVKAEMIALESGEFLRQLRNRELGPMHFSGTAPPADPHFMLSQYRSDWRYSYVQNAELDKLIDLGNSTVDEAQRQKYYEQATELMHSLAPSVYLYQSLDFYGATRRLKNWRPTGDQRIFLYGISLQ
ncbi:MAG: hypothetical protein HY423_05780 [Candidatus Lambdaproteobacteria bacterium]|nr:hypothetical protein [Candidatus Lambdaproteobacteria bacterium]